MSYLKIRILNKTEKKEIENLLKKQFGIDKIDGIISRRGKERLFLFKGNFSKKLINELESAVIIERFGLYFAKLIENRKTNKKEIRLSIEGTHLFKEKITKNIFEIKSKEQLEEWMKGNEILVNHRQKGFVAVKYKDDFLGCGKASEKKISNFIPKNRRLKEKQLQGY